MATGFRTRLVASVILLVAITAIAVATVGYLLVGRSLRNQLVDDAVARAEFNIGVLASESVLPAGSDRYDFEDSGLSSRFLLRGTDGFLVDFGDDDPYLSSLTLGDAASSVPAGVQTIVERGELGYQFVDMADEPVLLVAGRRPTAGPDFYFLFSAAGVQQSMADLRRIMLLTGGVVVIVAGAVTWLVVRQVLRPVRQAAVAAERMAAGDLAVRLPNAPGGDGFARWAASFNEMAASLEQKIAELEDAQRRERQFVADVSHELRTPLTGLVNEAAMAAEHLAGQPGGAPRIGELLVADVARLRTLVEDLLEISRLEASPAPVEPSEVDLRRFVAAVADERCPDADLTFAGPASVVVERRGLERIVGNLLDNARHHAPDAPVEVEVTVLDGELRIAVADRGPGVDEADLSRIFDRLAMADPSRQGGSGLGLAIARQHARRLGGQLSAHRRRGGGTLFRLSLPVTDSLPHGDGGGERGGQRGGER